MICPALQHVKDHPQYGSGRGHPHLRPVRHQPSQDEELCQVPQAWGAGHVQGLRQVQPDPAQVQAGEMHSEELLRKRRWYEVRLLHARGDQRKGMCGEALEELLKEDHIKPDCMYEDSVNEGHSVLAYPPFSFLVTASCSYLRVGIIFVNVF